MTNHPKHPALVHFPIAFTFLTGALDGIHYLSTQSSTSGLIATVFKTLSIQLNPSIFPVLSYYTTILTLLTSLPAISTGALELMPVIKRDGFSSKKAQIGVLHALINDVAVFATAWNWWTRRDNMGLAVSGWNQAVSVGLAVPATLAAAYLGGELVYGMGMGVGRGGASVRPVKKVQ
ncbi:hypothetical protein K504DRAFT_412793 [Pleomassaria siparia CBS 279.74]|uniref:DUF2231 domain-containing protein n=1 Tax=Pleomassaria siparia CBS 279.74 TaxID=1314801 RepID=A0A6G1K010_9PLEO|nr:hypothetical protein K504DRAFT_412793 [Pleomassaria siparia CBS 279.74]